MENVSVQIILPKGLRLKNGATLHQDVTFTLVSKLTPFYTSVDEVRLNGGTYLNKIPDLTLACAIYQYSRLADAMSWRRPRVPDPGAPETSPQVVQYNLWLQARKQWVNASVARQMILNIWDLAGTRGSKTLGNFSVNQMALVRDEDMPSKVLSLKDEIDKWLICLQSGGEVGPGGHVKGTVGAKQKYDVASVPPGRSWFTTGMGANKSTIPGYGSGQGPVKYSSQPFTMWQYGRYYGAYMAIFRPMIASW